MFAPRTYKRLAIAGNPHMHYDSFFLTALAYNQWSIKPPFSVGPKMCAYAAPEEYSYWSIAENINNTLRFFMKPHKIAIFGHDVKNLSKSQLLVRGWFQCTHESNNLLLIMERYEHKTDSKYWVGINNSSWRIQGWPQIENAQQMHQLLTLSNEPCRGSYNVQMELQ